MSALYALAKAVNPAASIADWTAYFVANALVPGPSVAMPNSPTPVSFMRVRLRDGI